MKVGSRLVVSLLSLGLVVSSAAVMALPKRVVGKIVGGQDAIAGEFPFIVSLQMNGFGHFCGGSLIKKNWVLTAAHCTRGVSIDNVVIGLQHLSSEANTESFEVKKVVVHPKYRASTSDYDFALVQLNGDSKYATVLLNENEINIPSDDDNIMSTVAGWGTTTEGSDSLPDTLQKVDVPLISHEACNKSYNGKITDRMICAGYPKGGKDSCQGDSGGPLMMNSTDGQRYLIGVVSWGLGCARPHMPGVYSKVNSVTHWISQTAQ